MGCSCLRVTALIIGISQCLLSTIAIIILLVELTDRETRKALVVIGCLANIILNFTLIYGAAKRKRGFVLPWIMLAGTGCFAATVWHIGNLSLKGIGFCALGWAQIIPVVLFYIKLRQTNISEEMELGNEIIVTSPLQESTIMVEHEKSQQDA